MTRVGVPPMLVDLVSGGIRSMEGMMFTGLDRCPYCGGAVKGHDIKRKRFATLLEKGKHVGVFVFVKRFYCMECNRLCYARSPFYPDTRLGSPIVDFCIANEALFPYHRIARLLKEMHVVVDRGTVRNYAQRTFGPVRYVEMYGMRIPLSLLSLSE